MTQLVHLYITAAHRQEAIFIARALLEARLVACANITDSLTSLFWWNGEIQESAESLLVAKTTASLAEAAIAKAKALHSYDCPCILVLPVTTGYAPYLAWLTQETREPPKQADLLE